MNLAAAMFVAAGGFVHAREWLDTYRDTPADVPGAAFVRVGFPINAGLSVLLAAALVVTAFRFRRWAPAVVVGAIVFQAGALAGLILSRTASVFGWAEPIWTLGADQTRAVEIGALVTLAALVMVAATERRTSRQVQPVRAS
ncbi:MAG: hypothetical protein ABIP72_02950 [Acidimicrobiales bacterium]